MANCTFIFLKNCFWRNTTLVKLIFCPPNFDCNALFIVHVLTNWFLARVHSRIPSRPPQYLIKPTSVPVTQSYSGKGRDPASVGCWAGTPPRRETARQSVTLQKIRCLHSDQRARHFDPTHTQVCEEPLLRYLLESCEKHRNGFMIAFLRNRQTSDGMATWQPRWSFFFFKCFSVSFILIFYLWNVIQSCGWCVW